MKAIHPPMLRRLRVVLTLAPILLVSAIAPMSLQAQESFRLYAVHLNAKGATWIADFQVEGNRIAGDIQVSWSGQSPPKIRCSRAKIKSDNQFKIWCKSHGVANRSIKGNFETATMNDNGGRAGGAEFRFLSGERLEEFLAAREQDPSLTTNDF